ncbi:Deoxyguanosinetriphosphate triphosphohydrolase-like protein [ANME-1 cluster archaeon GoMg3.2]|nr:Deoxyguanosinetriphosphate triphosphohydrolase-like protein [ANME-1 cluster archaeon GoMg3.2]
MKDKYKRTIKSDLEEKITSYIVDREDKCLSEFASKSDDGLRRKQKYSDDIRAKYSRDADRIAHTHAYSRYIDKTQVFSLVDNDHITHRVLHVQLVSKIARTIGRCLKLNEDLIEAVSLGHDIGHVPFGHLGESIMSELCERHGLGRFLHNVQGVQFLDTIEDCDLTLQVLDGILCHNGEIHNQLLEPNWDKGWEKLDKEIEDIKKGKQDYVPMTLEGCVVRFADTIAYLGRDFQDAIEICFINPELEVPERCRENIGTKNDEIINTLIIDIIENSYGQNYISYSKEISDSVEEYKQFNYEHIYENAKIKAEQGKIEAMYETLFHKFLNALEEKDESSRIYEHFMNVSWISREYLDISTGKEKVRDYIAGMTDRYFERVFKEIILPKRVTTFCKGDVSNV